MQIHLQEQLVAISMFQPEGVLRTAFRNALLLGSTPPHQATLFGPGARSMLNQYAAGFRLSADLDYFLRLSRHPGLSILCLDLIWFIWQMVE